MEQAIEIEQVKEEFDFGKVLRPEEGVFDSFMVAGLKKLDVKTDKYIRSHMEVRPLGRIDPKELQLELTTIAAEMKFTTKPRYTFDTERLANILNALAKAKFFMSSATLFFHKEKENPVIVSDDKNMLVMAPVTDE